MGDKFALITDSSCDLPESYLAEHDILSLQLSFLVDNKLYRCDEMDGKEFYRLIREGHVPTTTQVNVNQATQCMEPLLQAGQDVLYLAFSSGLSGTYESGKVAADKLQEQYPDRKVLVVDTLCASLGQGLLVHKANQLRNQGKSAGEVAAWAEENKLRMTHTVMVDNLMHLHRGGRVSKASAVMGTVLGIKPMLIMDDEGKLRVCGKSRGRKQALETALNMMEKCGVGLVENDACFISHSDCLEDAEMVAEMIRARFGIQEFQINYVGPVIGTHTGAGIIAIFAMGVTREYVLES